MADDFEISNFLLRSLPTHVAKAVVGAGEFIHLDLKEHIIHSNKPIEFVDFPESGVMSLLTPMENNLLVEIATIGREGS